MTVVSIVAILVTVAAPSFAEMMATQRVRGAASALTESLWLARAEATKRNTDVGFAFADRATGWTIPDPAGSATPLLVQAGFAAIEFDHAKRRRRALQLQRLRPALHGQRLGPGRQAHAGVYRCVAVRPPAARPRQGAMHMTPCAASGLHLIEVMVTVLLLAIGLLGMLGMQTRASAAEFESYQRGQAIALARDMQARLLSARGIVAGYLDPAISSVDGSVWVGTAAARRASSMPTATAGSRSPATSPRSPPPRPAPGVRDLQGVAMSDSAGAIGAMVGARGCLIRIEPPQQNALADLYVVIVWQGIETRTDPAADSPAGRCASDVDFGTGQRRGISMRVLVPDLRKAT